MLSFIVPAHNEQAWLPRSLPAIRDSLIGIDQPYEIIVVNDSSTDATGSIAEQNGATVIDVQHRQISASRNSGVKASQGEILFFVDADTLVTKEIIRSALAAIAEGAIGGGCIPRFEGRLPIWFRMSYPFMVFVMRRILHQTGAACLFCTRKGFEQTGGFSEEHYAAEEDLWVKSLKQFGKFVLLREPVLTSGRNLRSHSFFSIAKLFVKLGIQGANGFRKRENLDLWYQPRREDDRHD